ncbi:MAG: S8 family serine peptidase [Clostridia bacterium]|jgi:serine protease AprX|nr:S8 family serine peptidase [Clostridia bacterium]
MTNESIVVVDCLHTALKLFSRSGVKVSKIFPFISACAVSADGGKDRLFGLPFVRSAHKNCRVKAVGGGEPIISGTVIPPQESARGQLAKTRKNPKPSVAVIDTGVALHPDLSLFRSRIAAFKDFVAAAEIPYDDNGHGTAVTGVLCGCDRFSGLNKRNTAVSVVALKALDAGGEGNAFGILQAMQWVYDNAQKYSIKVVNMSFGCAEKEGAALRIGAEALVKSGLTVVASAGNGGEEEGILSPATSPFVITVGGADGFKAADFSARGRNAKNKPDLIAQAVDLPALTPSGGYTFVSGTSVAAPQVSAAAAALLAKYPDYTPDRIKSILKNGAYKLDGRYSEVGSGLLNASVAEM